MRDTGIGIEAEAQSGLFDPFTQADTSTTRKYGGTGLGLAICRRILDLMGGEISLNSTVGEGSTFRFIVPVERAHRPQRPRQQSVPATTLPDPRKPADCRVLVAEDNEVNRMVTRRLIESLGYQVHSVEDGLGALDALDKESFDIVFMDCQMPNLDGYQATAQIRQRHTRPGVPIVALTASALKEDLERCLASGMNDYLSKPCSQRDLEIALNRWLPSAPA